MTSVEKKLNLGLGPASQQSVIESTSEFGIKDVSDHWSEAEQEGNATAFADCCAESGIDVANGLSGYLLVASAVHATIGKEYGSVDKRKVAKTGFGVSGSKQMLQLAKFCGIGNYYPEKTKDSVWDVFWGKLENRGLASKRSYEAKGGRHTPVNYRATAGGTDLLSIVGLTDTE